jgi:hypothetical protein
MSRFTQLRRSHRVLPALSVACASVPPATNLYVVNDLFIGDGRNDVSDAGADHHVHTSAPS